MKDYYSLAAFFRNTTQKPKDGNEKDGRGPSLVVPVGTDRERWDVLPGEIEQAKRKRDARKHAAQDDFQDWANVTRPEIGRAHD